MDDDIDYGALFGVTLDSAQGPDESQEPEGGQEQGAALVASSGGPHPSSGGTTPAADAREDRPLPGAEDESEQTGQGTAPAEGAPPEGSQEPEDGQGPEGGQREDAAARARQDEAARRAVDEAFALSGLRNPYTGQLITSKAEYDAYRERFERERREQVLKQTGMTQEEFQRFVQELPEVCLLYTSDAADER